MRLVWSEDYELGIRSIDNQHKKIVEYINMIDDVHDDEAYQLAKNIVSKLVMYTRSHLEHEERIFEVINYELALEHKKAHDKFYVYVSGFQEKLNKVDKKFIQELHDFLREWFLNHILVDDKKYQKVFEENGIK